MEKWQIPRKSASKRVRYRLQAWAIERLSAWHQTVLVTFLGFRKLVYSCTGGMCHSCTSPPSIQVRHCTWLSFTRPSPTSVLQQQTLGWEGLGTRPGKPGVQDRNYMYIANQNSGQCRQWRTTCITRNAHYVNWRAENDLTHLHWNFPHIFQELLKFLTISSR